MRPVKRERSVARCFRPGAAVPGESGLPSSESDPLPLSTLVCVRILESGYGGRRKKRGSTNAVGICGERLFLWWGMDSRLKLKVGYQRSFTSDDLNGGDLIAASPQQQTLSRLTITGAARSSTLPESSVSDIDRRKEEPHRSRLRPSSRVHPHSMRLLSQNHAIGVKNLKKN